MPKTAYVFLTIIACYFLAGLVAVASIPSNLTQAPGLFVVGTGRNMELFYSADEGQTFRELELLPQGVRYGVFPKPSGGVWLATSYGLYSSDEALGHWEQVLESPVAWVVCSPRGTHCLYKVWGVGLFRTHEEGLQPGSLSESRLRIPLPVDAPLQSAIISDAGEIVAGFFGHGVFRTNDDGGSWEPMAEGLVNPQILWLAMTQDHRVYKSVFGGGLWVWHEKDSLWRIADPLFRGTNVETFVLGPAGGLLAGTREQGLVVSRDRGLSWEQALGLPGAYVQGAAITDDGSWWCYIPDQGLYVSRDLGELWVSKPFAFVNRVEQVALDNGGRWYGAVVGVGLVTSDDQGETFAILPLPVSWDPSMLFFLSPQQQLMLARDTDLWLSDDEGQTWYLDKEMSGKGPITYMGAGPDQTVYVVLNQRTGLYVKQGHQWQQVLAEEPWNDAYRVREMLFAPDFAVTHGLYDSLRLQSDGTWHVMLFGQTRRDFFFLMDGTVCSERMASTFRWDAQAERWQETHTVPQNERFRWWMPVPNGMVMAGPSSGFVRVEADGTIRQHDAFLATEILSLSANARGELLLGTGQGFWYSSDQGDSWVQSIPGF